MHYHPLPLPIPSHQGKNKTTTTRDISRKKVDGGGEGGEQSSCRNNTGLAIHSLAVNGLDNGNKWLRQFESDGTNSQRKQNRIHFTPCFCKISGEKCYKTVSVCPCLRSCYDNGSINICVTQVLHNGQVLIRGAGGHVHHKEVHLTPVNIT